MGFKFAQRIALWMRNASPGALLRQVRGPGQMRIGVRLTLSFAMIVLLMMASDVFTLWQFERVRTEEERVHNVDQESHAVLSVHANLLILRDKLEDVATTADSHRFATEAGALRRQFMEEVERANQALRSQHVQAKRDPATLSTLETIQSALPAQIDALTDLATANDWPAVRLRLQKQMAPLSSLTSSLVEKVDLEVAGERAQAQDSIQRLQQRAFLVLPLTAFFSLLVAAILGTMVTRSITRPLARLDAGAQALAQGEFQYRVAVEGRDELATLGRVFNDATQRLSALYGALRTSEEEFRIIFDYAAIGMVLVDPSGHLLRSNPAYRNMLGYAEGELHALTFADVTHTEDVALSQSFYQEVIEGKRDRYQFKKRFVRKDGDIRWARVTVSALRAASGELQYSVAMAEDITSQELAERTLLQMSARLLRIQEEEQRRIAREVHDSTSQEMTALTLNLGALTVSEHPFPANARKQIAESLALAKRVAREIRTFSYLLHPPMLNELGLWAALRMFVEEFKERSGLQVGLEISKEAEATKLHPSQEMAVFRLVQESLANIHRHSGSKTALVKVQLNNRWIEVSVTDTGRGIPPLLLKEIQASKGLAGGVGIPGMHERIGYIGGKLGIRSDEHGTTISAVVPLDYRSASSEGVPEQVWAQTRPSGPLLARPAPNENNLA